MKIITLLLLFSLSSWSQQDSVTITLDKNSSLELSREPFKTEGHQLEYKGNFLVAIDNVPVFGADGEIPKFQLAKAVLTISSKTYALQVDNMYNPWFGKEVNEFLFKIIHDNADMHILKAQFSDGAGSYAAQWLIEGNASIRDIITKNEIIIESYFQK